MNDLFAHRDDERLIAAGYRRDTANTKSPWAWFWLPDNSLKLTRAEALEHLAAASRASPGASGGVAEGKASPPATS